MGTGNIVLVGMPGAGKSSLGVVVAKRLGKGFLDADLVIQETYGKMLWELIEEHGPEGFIERENRVLAGIDAIDCVIATGGSAVYSEKGMAHLGSIGEVVYIRCALDELIARVGEIHERGVVVRPGVERTMAAILADREPLYERYADIVVNTEGLSAPEAVDAIVEALS